ncbi:DUF5623 domain-containing protein [Thioclava sp.]|uniref:DUF5623 domain-containing protein n=1 Tax=Thioclava sp. TaxID=1933450 RepID=UPI003AA87DD8
MLIDGPRPTTLVGVKRLARQLKKTNGIKHSDALDLAAKSADCANFRHAQRTLPTNGFARSKPYVLLTIYWSDEKQGYRCGRKTLRIELSMPILELCPKSALKYVRGFGNLRMVAEDHFVCDDIAHTQEYARDRLCTAERSLRFMEHTGLRPNRDRRKYPGVLDKDKLPNIDHSTDWVDPASGQFVLMDEPYGNVPDDSRRAAWADRNGWRLEKASWPGMYRPYDCDLYVGIDIRSGYDLDALMAKINSMPEPVVSENWTGESAPSWETFLSPMAKTKQDERRARCKGMIYPSPSKATVPYNYNPGCSRRRPVGELGIDGHVQVGRVIKALISSQYATDGVYTRLSSLRSDLEDWLSLEIGRGQLEGAEFFEVYYTRTEEDQALQRTLTSSGEIVEALRGLAGTLKTAYPDCASLRQQLRRIEMSASIIEKAR